MARSKIDRLIEDYQIKKMDREKEGAMDGQTQEQFFVELHWLTGVIYGLKLAKNRG